MALRREGAPEASQLRGALARCAAAAQQSGQARVLAVSSPLGDCDPLAAFAGFGEGERFFWEQPARGLALAARGAVLAVEADPSAKNGPCAEITCKVPPGQGLVSVLVRKGGENGQLSVPTAQQQQWRDQR